MAFKVADEILVNAVKGITELITEKGLVNLDFADVRTIMQNGGTAMIGIGESDGAESAQTAVEMAMQNKLLEIDIAGARNALINISGGAQMTLKDAQMVMKNVAEKLDPSAKIIWGARIDQNLGQTIRVMLIVTGLREKRKVVEVIKPPAQADDASAVQNDLQRNILYSQNSTLEKLIPEIETIVSEVGANGEYAKNFAPPTLLHNEKVNQSDQAISKRKRKSPLLKSRQQSDSHIPDKQVSKLVEPSEQAFVHDDVVRVTYADGLMSQESNVPAQIATVDQINEEVAKQNNTKANKITAGIAAATDIKTSPVESNNERNHHQTFQAGVAAKLSNLSATALNSEKDKMAAEAKSDAALSSKTFKPHDSREDFDRQFSHQTPAKKSPSMNGRKNFAPDSANNRPDQIGAKSTAPSSDKTGAYNKIFAEQSRAHLQIIRESIGQLFTDPTRQETLQRIKHAAIAVNNLAKRFVFDVLAAYAAAIEEICERVLDGEINMNKKLINAFTEIPAVFDGMVHGDVDALVEAKRHQERLQRLADSFVDGEVVNRDMTNKRNTLVDSAAQPATASIQKSTPAPMPSMSANRTTSPSNRRPRPATEVMEYLDDLFAEGKKPPGL
jgi:hypothetical protein